MKRRIIPQFRFLAVLFAAAGLVSPGEARADMPPDLSPASWKEGDLDQYNRLHQEFGGQNQLVTGAQGVITGTTGAPAIRAGLEALKQGGSAVDAALTTSLTQICLAAGSWVSYAGILTLVYYDAEEQKIYNLNAGYNTVLEEKDPLSIPAQNTMIPGRKATSRKSIPRGRTVLVPGYMKGVEAAHKRFGKLPFKEIFSPAIYYAENGFRLHILHQAMLSLRQGVLSRLPETKAVFTKPDGSFYKAGDLFRQPQLAKTLQKVAREDADYMYTGTWAKKFVEAVNRDHGKISLQDMKAYEVLWTDPLRIIYKDYEIHTHGLPAQGGVHLAEALNICLEADFAGMGHYSKSPESFFWLAQITNLMVLSFLPPATVSILVGGGDGSLESRIKPDHAQRLWARMKEGKFVMSRVPKTPDPKHSDAIVAIDGWGNIAALVHTINTGSWGETGIFVDGVSIPDSASFQQPLIQRTGPGKRLPDPTEPLIITKNGRPVAALSSIGAGLHQKTMSVLLNMLDFGMGIKEAVGTPSQHLPQFEGAMGKPQVFEHDFSKDLLDRVRKMGLKIVVLPNDMQSRAPRGYVVGAGIQPDPGRFQAVSTAHLNAPALAY